MPLEVVQQLPHRPVVGDRIRNRHDRIEPKVPIIVAGYDGPPVWAITTSVLHVVEALGVRLPDIHFGALQGISGLVTYGTENEAGLAIGVARYGATIINKVGIMCMERPEDCAVRGALWLGVIHRVNEERDSQDIAKKNEFLPRVSSLHGRVASIRLLTWRTSVQICPTDVRKWIAFIHSSLLRRVALTKSCRCVTSISKRYFDLRSGH